MKINVNLLNDQALDWIVSKCLGYEIEPVVKGTPIKISGVGVFQPTLSWSWFHLFENDNIELIMTEDGSNWRAIMNRHNDQKKVVSTTGPTKLIAAMRCFVIDRRGEIINIPVALK